MDTDPAVVDWSLVVITILAMLGGGILDKLARWFWNNRRILTILVDTMNRLMRDGSPEEQEAMRKLVDEARRATATPNKEREEQMTGLLRTSQLKAGLAVADELADKRSRAGKLAVGIGRVLPLVGRFLR